MTTYKPHYACFECRKTFKRRLLKDIKTPDAHPSAAAKCPECGSLMADMGLDFKSPLRDDLKAWQHMRNLYAVGITYHSCGCSGPGYIPADAAALANLFLHRKEEYIRNLRFWLNKADPVNAKDIDRDKARNSNEYGKVYHLQGKKGGVVAQEAVAYWTEQLHAVEHNLGKVLAGI
ncbi:hypothetical protein J4E00_15385 [Siccationidurans soli]|uniref:Uncharacterized protein n=2 Tax=Hymenobacter negativus TaxID=2795026 RepID=A0ABS3QHJ0_9BACT|nr:hypothetical protein [Hymenobacter negativus]